MKEENLKQWFDAETDCGGVGSTLSQKNSDGAYDYEQITNKPNSALDIGQNINS